MARLAGEVSMVAALLLLDDLRVAFRTGDRPGELDPLGDLPLRRLGPLEIHVLHGPGDDELDDENGPDDQGHEYDQEPEQRIGDFLQDSVHEGDGLLIAVSSRNGRMYRDGGSLSIGIAPCPPHAAAVQDPVRPNAEMIITLPRFAGQVVCGWAR